MSCTVIAVPYALAWVVGAVATAAAAAIENAHNKSMENEFSFLESTNCNNNEEVHTITTEHFIEKDFETPFVDNELLIKTLEEHGVNNINNNGNEIFGSVDNYNLTFKRNSSDEPYKVRISCKENENASSKLDDLNSEYAMNVQEDAYLHIVEKLKDNNMSIEEEVVEDDNTIVLTVNIEQ